MIKKLKNLLMSLTLASMFVMPAFAPAVVHAATDLGNCANTGANLNIDPANCENTPADPNSTDTINRIAKLVINIFSLVVGLISVIMIIIGGLKYITSGGDSANVTGAKNTILYAVIGLVVVALAQFIVRFVLAKVSESTTTGVIF